MTACQVLPDHRPHRREDTFSSHTDACRTPPAAGEPTRYSLDKTVCLTESNGGSPCSRPTGYRIPPSPPTHVPPLWRLTPIWAGSCPTRSVQPQCLAVTGGLVKVGAAQNWDRHGARPRLLAAKPRAHRMTRLVSRGTAGKGFDRRAAHNAQRAQIKTPGVDPSSVRRRLAGSVRPQQPCGTGRLLGLGRHRGHDSLLAARAPTIASTVGDPAMPVGVE